MQELFALADAEGHSTAELSSEDEAENFRFALYKFRRRTARGNAHEITLVGKSVHIRRRLAPLIKVAGGSPCP